MPSVLFLVVRMVDSRIIPCLYLLATERTKPKACPRLLFSSSPGAFRLAFSQAPRHTPATRHYSPNCSCAFTSPPPCTCNTTSHLSRANSSHISSTRLCLFLVLPPLNYNYSSRMVPRSFIVCLNCNCVAIYFVLYKSIYNSISTRQGEE